MVYFLSPITKVSRGLLVLQSHRRQSLFSFLIRDRLYPQKLLEAPAPIEPPPSTHLGTAMRQITLIVHCHGIDMHSAALNLPRNAQPTRQILRKDGARQAILGIISNGNRLLL